MRSTSMMIGAVALTMATGAWAQSPQVVTEEMMVPSDPGIEIYVRNKRPADMTAFRPERTLLYVHGATYPAIDGVRPQARRPVMDGLHRGARLRRLPPRPARLRQVDAAARRWRRMPRPIRRSCAARPPSRTSARRSISSSRAATSRAST